MKLPVSCNQCWVENPVLPPTFTTLEWNDDGRYEASCPKGHVSITILQEEKFELLFDIGAYALVDGYCREAVTAFASSLERLFEYMIRVVLLDKKFSEDFIEAIWKPISKQSERQLGAYAMLYACELGRPAPVLPNPKVAFRNEVVHRGKIPTRVEALEFGNAVLGIIRPVLSEIQGRYGEGIRKRLFQHLKECGQTKGIVTTASISTIVSVSRLGDKDWNSRSLETALASLMRW